LFSTHEFPKRPFLDGPLDDVGVEAAFSPDTKYLAIANEHPLARVWDWQANKEVARIVNIDGMIGRVAFSPDGRYLATGGLEGDHSVRLWELPYKIAVNPDRLGEEACSRLRRNLSQREWKQVFGTEPYQNTCPGLPQGIEKSAETRKDAE
jgi:WD40 repeat protein